MPAAARRYYRAALAAIPPNADLRALKQLLHEANIASSAAFAAEGMEPPRDPGPQPAGTVPTGEAPMARRPGPSWGVAAAGVGIAGVLLVPLLFMGRRGKKGGRRRGSAARWM